MKVKGIISRGVSPSTHTPSRDMMFMCSKDNMVETSFARRSTSPVEKSARKVFILCKKMMLLNLSYLLLSWWQPVLSLLQCSNILCRPVLTLLHEMKINRSFALEVHELLIHSITGIPWPMVLESSSWLLKNIILLFFSCSFSCAERKDSVFPAEVAISYDGRFMLYTPQCSAHAVSVSVVVSVIYC